MKKLVSTMLVFLMVAALVVTTGVQVAFAAPDQLGPYVTISAYKSSDINPAQPGYQSGLTLVMSGQEGSYTDLSFGGKQYRVYANRMQAIEGGSLMELPSRFILQRALFRYLMGTDQRCSNYANSCILNYELK